jgi:hypothetical protein
MVVVALAARNHGKEEHLDGPGRAFHHSNQLPVDSPYSQPGDDHQSNSITKGFGDKDPKEAEREKQREQSISERDDWLGSVSARGKENKRRYPDNPSNLNHDDLLSFLGTNRSTDLLRDRCPYLLLGVSRDQSNIPRPLPGTLRKTARGITGPNTHHATRRVSDQHHASWFINRI